MVAKKVADNREPLSGFRFSSEANNLLNQLCELTKRNRTNMIEFLIQQEAERLGLIKSKLPDVLPEPKRKK